MRILLVSLHHVEYAVELAQALGEKNRVHLVLRKEKVSQTIGDQIHKKIREKVTCTQLPYKSLKDQSVVKVLLSIIQLYFKFQPEVIHIQESVDPLNLFFLLLGLKRSVLTVHDVIAHPGTPQTRKIFWKTRLLRLSRRLSKKVIVHGEKLKEQFLQTHKRSAQDLFVVPHGSLFSFLPNIENEINEEAHTVLFFGRMQKYKGLKYLIDSEPFVRKVLPDYKIIVAGVGSDIETHRSRLLSNSHFELHERFIPNDEVFQFFLRSSVVVLPYIEASQSGIASMAFAFGKPVIATNVGSIPEMVENNRTGIIVPPKNKEILAQAIIKLLNNTEKRKFLSHNARQVGITKFGWNHIAELTIKLYEQVINSKRMNN